jgi:hypothetical protein
MGYAHATHRGTPAPRSGTPSPPDYSPGTHRTGSLPPRKPATRPASRTPCLPKRPQPCPRTARGRLPPPRPAPRLPRPTNRAHDGSRLAARPGVADRWGGRAGSLLILCSCRSPLPQAVGDSGTPQPEPPSCHSPSSQAAADSGTPQPETAGELAALSERLRQPPRVVQKFERTAPRRSSALCRALIKQMRHAVLPGSAVGYLMGVVRGGTPLTSRHWLSQRRVTARA